MEHRRNLLMGIKHLTTESQKLKPGTFPCMAAMDVERFLESQEV